MEHSNQNIEKLAKRFSYAISTVDESLHFRDFASAVALVLKEDYGSHLYEGFLSQLKKDLKNVTMESTKTNNFDLKKFIVENRLTPQSRTVNEQQEDNLPKRILIQYTTSGRFYGLYLYNQAKPQNHYDRIRGVDNANEYIERLTGKPSNLPLANYSYNEDDVEAAAESLRKLGIEVSHNDNFDTD